MENGERSQPDVEESAGDLQPCTSGNHGDAKDRNQDIPQSSEDTTSGSQDGSTSRMVSMVDSASASTGANAAVQISASPVTKESPECSQQPKTTASVRRPAIYKWSVPQIKCPEKVILCLDLSEEMSMPSLETAYSLKTSALTILQKTIEIFVTRKHQSDKRYEFALVAIKEEAVWVSGFTCDPLELCTYLYDLETDKYEPFSLENLLNVIRQKIEVPLMDDDEAIPTPYAVRTLLIYSRHAAHLHYDPSDAAKKLLQSPYFFFGLVYLHIQPEDQQGEIEWRLFYPYFRNPDTNGLWYHFEVSPRGPTSTLIIQYCVTKLLTHPLPRNIS